MGQLQPYGSCLIHWEKGVIFIRGVWKRTCSRPLRIRIVQDGNSFSSSPSWGIHKPRTGDYVIITGSILIHCNEKGIWLANMNIHVCVVLLHCVRSFGLYKKQVMILNSKIHTSRDTNIVHSKAICLSCQKESMIITYDLRYIEATKYTIK